MIDVLNWVADHWLLTIVLLVIVVHGLEDIATTVARVITGRKES